MRNGDGSMQGEEGRHIDIFGHCQILAHNGNRNKNISYLQDADAGSSLHEADWDTALRKVGFCPQPEVTPKSHPWPFFVPPCW